MNLSEEQVVCTGSQQTAQPFLVFVNHIMQGYPLALAVIEAAQVNHQWADRGRMGKLHEDGTDTRRCKCGVRACPERIAIDQFLEA